MNKEMLKDKVCIVTGAGKGIGSETAKLFYEEGAKLVLISRDLNDLKSLKKEVKKSKETEEEHHRCCLDQSFKRKMENVKAAAQREHKQCYNDKDKEGPPMTTHVII